MNDKHELERLQIKLQGAVQGVGFRPFIYRLATNLGLTGWVKNSSQGVWIEIEGRRSQLDLFLCRLKQEKPPQAIIQHVQVSYLALMGNATFEIYSSIDGEKTAIILPDLATCSDCLKELFDPTNPRYRYPFINCTHCGPRFSIIKTLPYDRTNTSMSPFEMCDRCRAEYENPLDRRFHAQPIACPTCGPHLEWWDQQGQRLAFHEDALQAAVQAIQSGQIIAVKGLGGFHLMVDARNPTALAHLRQRKHRPDKPFALMYPSLDTIQNDCELSDLEAQLLTASEAPIVLLRRKAVISVDELVAPSNAYLGVLLPYTPLHHLLLSAINFPIVATSGNLSSEPICVDEWEAVSQLQGIADAFLVHNRPILRPIDDSIVRVIADRGMILRRSRGYVPLPIALPKSVPTCLALGAHLKNTIALTIHSNVFVSQHIGDLENQATLQAFEQAIDTFEKIYEVHPNLVACDSHPDYLSTQYAQQHSKSLSSKILPIQHHHAHIAACMSENGLEETVLGVGWDGTGYGLDGTIWGGEFLLANLTNFQRVGHFKPFRLPGGEKAIREPRRAAIALLYELWGEAAFDRMDLAPIQSFSPQERAILQTMLNNKLNTPWTSSVGRLFDAIAALLNLIQISTFEGQAAMVLESALDGLTTDEFYPVALHHGLVDWSATVQSVISDIEQETSVAMISAKFHNTMVETIVQVAQQLKQERVVLSGGCFQNRYLSDRTISRLKAAGFQPYWHCRIPPNDGGIAVGQAIVAASQQSIHEG
jgi:hydrogenase maturation protein HypF